MTSVEDGFALRCYAVMPGAARCLTWRFLCRDRDGSGTFQTSDATKVKGFDSVDAAVDYAAELQTRMEMPGYSVHPWSIAQVVGEMAHMLFRHEARLMRNQVENRGAEMARVAALRDSIDVVLDENTARREPRRGFSKLIHPPVTMLDILFWARWLDRNSEATVPVLVMNAALDAAQESSAAVLNAVGGPDQVMRDYVQARVNANPMIAAWFQRFGFKPEALPVPDPDFAEVE